MNRFGMFYWKFEYKLVLTNCAAEICVVGQNILRLHAAIMTFVLTEMPQRGNKTI